MTNLEGNKESIRKLRCNAEDWDMYVREKILELRQLLDEQTLCVVKTSQN